VSKLAPTEGIGCFPLGTEVGDWISQKKVPNPAFQNRFSREERFPGFQEEFKKVKGKEV